MSKKSGSSMFTMLLLFEQYFHPQCYSLTYFDMFFKKGNIKFNDFLFQNKAKAEVIELLF